MEYLISPVTVDDKSLITISRFLQESFPKSSKFSFEYIKWQYATNPIGDILGYNAFYGEDLAAHYVTMPIIMNLFGEKKKGLLALNTATHRDHRGKKLFTILAEKTHKIAIEYGFEFVIAATNDQSTHGFLFNLGFYLISPLNVKFGYGMKLYENIDAKCCRVWNKELIEWRLNNPSSKYIVKDDIITSPIGFCGVKGVIGHIPSELLVQNELNFKKKCSYRPINLYVGLGANLSNCVYFNIPFFIKHSPFNLVFKNLNENIPNLVKEDVFFQLIDFDVI